LEKIGLSHEKSRNQLAFWGIVSNSYF
jgi:hypothetical protein